MGENIINNTLTTIIVINGSRQNYRINYTETFSPGVWSKSAIINLRLSNDLYVARIELIELDITAFLRQNDKFDKFDGLENNNWWCLLAYMCDITEKLNKLNRGLQGENKIISQMANKVFAFEKKLEIYNYKEIQNKVLHNFQPL